MVPVSDESAKAYPPEVRFINGEADYIRVEGRDHTADDSDLVTYTFNVLDGTAVLTKIIPDEGDVYEVQKHKVGRKEVREAVAEIPVIDEVVMFDDDGGD